MGKMKEKFKNLLGNQKVYLKKYCMTFILIAFITIMMVVNLYETEHIGEFYTTFILTTILVFAVETYADFKWYRIPMYILAFVLSMIAKNIIFSEDITVKQGLLILGLYLSAILLAIYKIIKDSNITISQYLSKIFNNYIIIGIASIILQLGTLFLVTITNALLLKNYNLDLYLRTEILLLGFFMIPAGILGILNINNEVSKAVKVIICYIILPIVTAAELIIYIYFAKILIIREIPSNVIFAIIASLFTFAFPTWIMIDAFKDKNKYIETNSKIIPYSFIPLICMQIYSIGIRIIEYGVTPERYIGVMLVLFEIVAVVLTLIKEQKHLNKIVLVGMGFIIVTLCIPSINVIDFSWKNQLARLNSVYKENTKFDSLSEEAKKKAAGAYRYLRYDTEGEKHIPNYIDKEALNNYNLYLEDRPYYEKAELDSYVNYNNYNADIPVEGYKTLRTVHYYKYAYNEEFKIENMDTRDFEDYNEEYRIEIKNNLILLVKRAMEEEKITEQSIKLSESKTLWINSFNLRYNKDTNQITNLSIDGYLLKK